MTSAPSGRRSLAERVEEERQPPNPIAIPSRPHRSRFRTRRVEEAIQIGIVPTRSAATPAGTVCCAHASEPWPVTKRRPPKTNARDLPRADRSSRDRPRSANGERSPATRCRRHREERRQVADDDRERDERRSPDEVDRHEGEPDPHAVSRSHRSGWPSPDIISSSPGALPRSPRLIASPRPHGGTSRRHLVRIDRRVELRRRDIPAPATRLGASGLPVRHLDGLLRRPTRSRAAQPIATSPTRSPTASGSSASSSTRRALRARRPALRRQLVGPGHC